MRIAVIPRPPPPNARPHLTLLRQAAAVLAKSGLGKAELGRLWVVSDVDRDGALSRVEFSIAMHLALCSASRKLPVPSALPESLVALLPPEKDPARAAVAGGDNKRGGNKAENAKEARKRGEDEEDENQTGEEPEIAETTTKPSKKRGFGMFSSPSPGAAETTKKPSTAGKKGTAASKSVSSIAGASGDQKGKRAKKAGSGDDQEEKQDGNKVSLATGKRKSLSFVDPKGGAEMESKTLTAKLSKRDTKNGGTAREVSAAAATGEREGVDSAGTASTKNVASEEKGEGNGTGEDGGSSSSAEHQSAGARDGDGDDAGNDDDDDGNLGDAAAEEGCATSEEKAEKKKKKPLSDEERDQLYDMTTSERAGYDVVFMQVGARGLKRQTRKLIYSFDNTYPPSRIIVHVLCYFMGYAALKETSASGYSYICILSRTCGIGWSVGWSTQHPKKIYARP